MTSALGYPAYYPVHPVSLEKPVRAVLMDLDGTSVRSEDFWVGIIQQTTASLLGDPGFQLSPGRPALCLRPQRLRAPGLLPRQVRCPAKTVEEARAVYFRARRREMQAILDDPAGARRRLSAVARA